MNNMPADNNGRVPLFASNATANALVKPGILELGIMLLPEPYTPVALAHRGGAAWETNQL